jgi:hypothetical protein
MEENNNNNSIDTLIERAGEYLKNTIELSKLKAVDKLSDTVGNLVSRTVAGVFLILFFLLGSVAISLLIGDALGKSWYGFAVVAGFYALIGFILIFFSHNWLKQLVSNSIVKKFFNNNHKDS